MNDCFLIIDDEISFAETLARSIARKGKRTCIAHTSADALTLQQQEKCDKILLDLNLKGDSGMKLLPQLLAITPEAKIVMLTGYASIVTAVEAIKSGALNYLCKPVTVSEILTAFAETESRDSPKVDSLIAGVSESNDAQETNDEPDNLLEPVSLGRMEWEHIQRVLAENNGNISSTARALKMHRRTLQRKLMKKPGP